MKPIPTEYKQIVFRSKSEAIFAHAMTLSGAQWEYEPGNWDGYTPDFAVFLGVRGWPEIYLNVLVEYKPSIPTDTYVQRLQKVKIPDCYDAFFVFYGTAYDNPSAYGWIGINFEEEREQPLSAAISLAFCDPVMDKMQEAKAYRFDLKQ